MNLDSFKTNMENLYTTYCENLYFYKNEDHSKLEEMNIKSLNTPADKKKFFVVKNSEGIMIVTTSLSSAISLSFKEYKEYLQGNELQHKSYAIPVFDEILRTNGFECEIGKFWHTSGHDLHTKSVKDWGEKRKKMDAGHSCFLYHNAPYKNIYAVGTIAINGDQFSVLDIKPLENKITDSEIRFFWSDFNPQPTQQFKNRMLLNYIVKQNSDVFYINHTNSQHSSEKTAETNKSHPLNQILYGSPGTGKTYSTIEKALEILGVDTRSKNRQELKAIFDDYKAKGQIEFVTFHQNYGYEEFVEGIKPISHKNGEITYKVIPGIFKKLCKKAECYNKLNKPIDTTKNLWRLYTLPGGRQDEDYFDECKEYVYANKDFGKERLISSEVQKGDYIVIPSAVPGKRSKSIRAFGVFGDVIKEKMTDEEKPGYRSVEWYWIANNEDEEIIFEGVDFGQPSFRKVEDFKDKILNYFKSFTKPYILIIDEINRGNISKIFGELITLIEPSKRIVEEEELRVTLPYSQDSFGVPSNLYIIGTMNTADRSITSLDTALRRRFEFVEMMPNPEALTNLKVYREDKDTKINLVELLQAINDRIEFFYDREKTIGHAFFLSEDKDHKGIITLEQLKGIFQNKIIPLLQEYFYNDYEAIQAVLNDNGMIEVKADINKQKKPKYIFEGAFKNFVNDRGLDEKKIFKIAPKDQKNIWDEPNTYKKIYGEGNNNEAIPTNPTEQ